MKRRNKCIKPRVILKTNKHNKLLKIKPPQADYFLKQIRKKRNFSKVDFKESLKINKLIL